MIALIYQHFLELSLGILDYSLGMIGGYYLIFLAIEEYDWNIEFYLFVEIYIERIIFLTDSTIEDTGERRLDIAQSHLYYKIWD